MAKSKQEDISILTRLKDLQRQSERQNRHIESFFLNEEELALAQTEFKEGPRLRYDGGYTNALKKKAIFLVDEEDSFSDIVCIQADIDQRFHKISHRDILGALMHLQIDRHSFGDFWIEEDHIYIYTSSIMAEFLIDNLIRISNLNVSFYQTENHPEQKFQYKKITTIVSSLRLDAIVASLAHISRSEAKRMITQGLVQVNHVTLVDGDELCNNNSTISIRGKGRFRYTGSIHKTKKDRIVVEFLESI